MEWARKRLSNNSDQVDMVFVLVQAEDSNSPVYRLLAPRSPLVLDRCLQLNDRVDTQLQADSIVEGDL